MLIVTPIKNNNNLLNTINSHIKLRKLKEIDVNIREEENKNYSSLYYFNSNSDTATKKTRIKAYTKLDSLLDSDDYCLDSSLDINSKDNLEDEKATIAKDLLTTIYSANKQTRIRDSLSIRKNKVVAIDPANSILCDLSNLLVIRFYIFSNSALENIGILINKEVIILEANMPAMHSKAIKHYLALLAVQFIIVCSFRKVDKHIFRAYNTISFNATNKRDSVTSNCIYKIEDIRNIIANIKYDASEHKSSYKDILEKEGFNKLEASRRVIFNCFKMQAIAFYSALATLKVAYVKDLFINLSKDYFLSIIAEDIAKAANTLLLLKEVCAKILIESYKLIVQALVEICVSIIYFNLDSELELKVLGK
ncbi:hypothetical protein HBI45_079670 [Parastagonospora nodorum]|nr:hypothetical protein HBI45_079670 [Parastagonospora nodorum]